MSDKGGGGGGQLGLVSIPTRTTCQHCTAHPGTRTRTRAHTHMHTHMGVSLMPTPTCKLNACQYTSTHPVHQYTSSTVASTRQYMYTHADMLLQPTPLATLLDHSHPVT